MVNMLVTVRIFGPSCSKRKVPVKCNNQAVVHVLNDGRTRDAFLAACMWNMWLEVALYYILLLYKHVLGRQNTVADLFSR